MESALFLSQFFMFPDVQPIVVYLLFVAICFALLAGVLRRFRANHTPAGSGDIPSATLQLPQVVIADCVDANPRKTTSTTALPSRTAVTAAPPVADRLIQNEDEDEDEANSSSQWSTNTAELLRLSSSESETECKFSPVRNGQRRSVPSGGSRGKAHGPSVGVLPTIPNAVATNKSVHRITHADTSKMRSPAQEANSKPPPSSSRTVPTNSSQNLGNSSQNSKISSQNSKSFSFSDRNCGKFSDNDESRTEIRRFEEWITKDGGVRKIIDTSGSGESPQPRAIVEYLMKIATNLHFKCPRLYAMDEPTKSTLETSEMIAGLELALLSMKVKERAIFRIEPKYGYGMERSDVINVSSKDVIYIYIELLNVLNVQPQPMEALRFLETDPVCRWSSFTPSQLADAGTQLQCMGKNAFAEGQHSQAAHFFKEVQAIAAQKTKDMKEDSPGLPNQRNSLLAQLQNNVAVCFLKEKKWSEVTEHAQAAFDLKADHASMAKACYLLGKAARESEGVEVAMQFLQRGLRFNRLNSELNRLLEEYKTEGRHSTLAPQKEAFKKMFAQKSGSSSDDVDESKVVTRTEFLAKWRSTKLG